MPTVGAAKASDAPVPLHRDDQPSLRTMWRATPHALRCTAGQARSGAGEDSTQQVRASTAKLRFPAQSAYLSALTHDDAVPDTVQCRLEWPVGGTGVAREWRRVRDRKSREQVPQRQRRAFPRLRGVSHQARQQPAVESVTQHVRRLAAGTQRGILTPAPSPRPADSPPARTRRQPRQRPSPSGVEAAPAPTQPWQRLPV